VAGVGRLNVIVAPLLSLSPFPLILLLFSAHILPPWACMIPLQINNPKPVPRYDIEANFENNLPKISLFIPLPVSVTLTSTSFLLSPLS
jgi:hypothetical protein